MEGHVYALLLAAGIVLTVGLVVLAARNRNATNKADKEAEEALLKQRAERLKARQSQPNVVDMFPRLCEPQPVDTRFMEKAHEQMVAAKLGPEHAERLKTMKPSLASSPNREELARQADEVRAARERDEQQTTAIIVGAAYLASSPVEPVAAEEVKPVRETEPAAPPLPPAPEPERYSAPVESSSRYESPSSSSDYGSSSSGSDSSPAPSSSD